MKNIVMITGLLVLFWSNFAYAQEQITAKELDAKCVKEGAVNVVNELTRGWNNPAWEAILAGISSGDEAWINASACIGRSADYSNVNVMIDLSIAWGEALPKNPKAILALGARGISLGRICTTHLIETDRAFIEQYVNRALEALESVPADAKFGKASLDIEKQVCILRLKDAYENEMKR